MCRDFIRAAVETHPGGDVSRELAAAIREQEMPVSGELTHDGVWRESLVSSCRRREKVSAVRPSHGGHFQWKYGAYSVKKSLCYC